MVENPKSGSDSGNDSSSSFSSGSSKTPKSAKKLSYERSSKTTAINAVEQLLVTLSKPLAEKLTGKESFFNFIFLLDEAQQTAACGNVCDILCDNGETLNVFTQFSNLEDKDIVTCASKVWSKNPGGNHDMLYESYIKN
eukprot:scaffold123248_cov80-Attheya_sp.AAC.2